MHVCLPMLLLVSLSTWHRLKSLEKREPYGENASIRLADRQVYRAFSWLMTDVEGSTPRGQCHA